MTTLPLKASRKNGVKTVFCHSFSVGKRTLPIAQIPFTLRCVQYMATRVLQDQQYMFGVRSLLGGQKSKSDREV